MFLRKVLACFCGILLIIGMFALFTGENAQASPQVQDCVSEIENPIDRLGGTQDMSLIATVPASWEVKNQDRILNVSECGCSGGNCSIPRDYAGHRESTYSSRAEGRRGPLKCVVRFFRRR